MAINRSKNRQWLMADGPMKGKLVWAPPAESILVRPAQGSRPSNAKPRAYNSRLFKRTTKGVVLLYQLGLYGQELPPTEKIEALIDQRKAVAFGMEPLDVVVKIQIPVASNEPTPMGLIYDQERRLNFQVPVTADLMQWFEVCEYKVYVEALVLMSEGELELKVRRKLEPQPW